MKIGMYLPHHDYRDSVSGQTTLPFYLAEGLRELGQEVDLLCPLPPHTFPKKVITYPPGFRLINTDDMDAGMDLYLGYDAIIVGNVHDPLWKNEGNWWAPPLVESGVPLIPFVHSSVDVKLTNHRQRGFLGIKDHITGIIGADIRIVEDLDIPCTWAYPVRAGEDISLQQIVEKPDVVAFYGRTTTVKRVRNLAELGWLLEGAGYEVAAYGHARDSWETVPCLEAYKKEFFRGTVDWADRQEVLDRIQYLWAATVRYRPWWHPRPETAMIEGVHRGCVPIIHSDAAPQYPLSMEHRVNCLIYQKDDPYTLVDEILDISTEERVEIALQAVQDLGDHTDLLTNSQRVLDLLEAIV